MGLGEVGQLDGYWSLKMEGLKQLRLPNGYNDYKCAVPRFPCLSQPDIIKTYLLQVLGHGPEILHLCSL